jgi:hypothetical protein
MKNKEFNSIDKLAKEALENFEANFNPLDWLEMEQQLDADKSVDQLAKKVLGDYETSFAEDDWLQFEQYRKQKKQPVPFIPWFKSAEIGILVLFILSFSHYLPSKNTPESEQTPTHSPKVELENLMAAQSGLTTEQQTKAASLNSPLNHVPITVTTESSTTALPSETNKPTVSLLEKSSVSAVRVDAQNSPNSFKDVLNNDPSNTKDASIIEASETKNFTKNSIQNQIAFGQEDQKDEVRQAIIEQQAAQLKINRKTKALQQLLPVHLQLIPQEIEPIHNLTPVQLKKTIYKKIYLGGIASLSANIENEFGGSSIGYGAGFSFDIDFGAKFGLRTAFMFRSKQYTKNYTLASNTLDNVSYSIASTVQRNLVVLTIPLDFQYTFFRSDKWKIFATAGLEANFIASRTYRGSEQTTFNGLTLIKDIQNNQFNRGFVEGGQFVQNAYLSLGGGIGLERQLGDRFSIYILPVYRHAVTAVGGVHIHSFNFNIGLRTSL